MPPEFEKAQLIQLDILSPAGGSDSWRELDMQNII
jgi:hypothetical protein